MDTILIKKICKTCEKEKNFSDFHKDSYKKNGLTSACKQCRTKKKREAYKIKTKKVDEKLLIKQKFMEIIGDYNNKILNCDDPDEIGKIHDDYTKNIEDYRIKLSELTQSSQFNLVNENQDELVILGRVQQHLLSKKIMIIPSQIKIEKSERIIKVTLPENIKLTKDEVAKITKDIKQ